MILAKIVINCEDDLVFSTMTNVCINFLFYLSQDKSYFAEKLASLVTS